MSLRCPLSASSLRDLLAVLTSFSLLSLFLTYQLGFPAGRFQVADSRPEGLLYNQELSSPFGSPKMQHLLIQLEKEQLRGEGRRVAVFHGGQHRDLPLYLQALQKRGFSLLTVNSSQDTWSQQLSTYWQDRSQETSDWTLLFCNSPLESDPDCLHPTRFLTLKNHQKVNRIPGIHHVLAKRAGLCQLSTQLARLPALNPHSLTPTCFSLPDQFEELINIADGVGFNNSWMLKPSRGNIELISTMQLFNRVRLKRFPDTAESLVQEYIPNQLRVLEFPVSVQLFVLITSVAPLRAYLYKEGVVQFRYGQEKSFKKIPKKWWLLSQLWNHVATTQGVKAVKLALENTDQLLVHLLLGAESFLLIHLANLTVDSHRYRCEHCFQLLTVEVIHNSTFHPTVMGVSDQLSLGSEALGSALLADVVRLVSADARVHQDVGEALITTATHHNTGVAGVDCVISNELCLTKEDLNSMLTSRREALASGDFRRLYPTAAGQRYSPYIDQLQSLRLRDTNDQFHTANALLRETSLHATADLHDLLTRMEEVYASQEDVEDYAFSPKQTKTNSASFNLKSVDQYSQLIKEEIPEENCMKDVALRAYLKSLVFWPSVELTPSFTALWTEYVVEVAYDTTMIRVTAVPIHCGIESRFEHPQGTSHSVNSTLGLGENRLVVYLVEAASGETVNSYDVTLIRRGLVTRPLAQTPSVCSFRQECEYRIFPGVPCGLMQERSNGRTAWSSFLKEIQLLPPCSSGDAFGRWVVPCASCSSVHSCDWSEARWQPYSCTHRIVSKERLATCLQGKKLLFLGDSTNRGMMHYTMERLNGTLSGCDKTHHIRVYSELNEGRTTLSFAYYPQFWLPVNERPVFDKTLYQLLLRSQPLQNTSDTVVIVGGVHWLATQHLHMLMRVLRSEGLQGAKLVVKTLGSGFHIAAQGVHYLSKSQQEKLLLHSMGLAAFAHHHRMEVVDTFNMTTARYKDFLQGKCACHFHKLVDTGAGYHVEGPINAIYTEILLSRLCPANGT